ncbi:MAG: Do family serine endopeptidase [Spirochaetales bacterium]|nr:Do family serine endopeptidase [Spirochaetales bacterium]
MKHKKSIFYSKKFLIINVALLSMILGFVISTAIIYSCSNGGAKIPHAYANDYDNVEQGMAVLQDIQYSFRNVAGIALPVVVEINVVEVVKQRMPDMDSPWEYFFEFDEDGNPHKDNEGKEYEYKRPGLGSGVIVRRTGNKVYVVTNNHVVGNADEISVKLHDEREFKASIVGKDARTDLALVVFETGDEVPVARLGDSDKVFVGDWAIAVGNPLGFESSMTVGVVSALGRRPDDAFGMGASGIANFTDYIQTDASINQGNSGGALLNIQGEVIGINTWIASRTGQSIGLGFAIPINNAKKVIEDFIAKGKVEYGWLGVQIGDPNPAYYPGVVEDLGIEGKKGALVLNSFKNSPAYKAGILPGDLVIKVDSVEIKDANHLTAIVGHIPPGKNVEFVIIRYGREKKIWVTLTARDEEAKVQSNTNIWPGMVPLKINDEIRSRLKLPDGMNGVVIGNIITKAPAGLAGLRQGDVVVKINNKKINTVMDFYKALNDSTTNEILFRVYREGSEVILGVVK